MPETLACVSVRQPWADLIVAGIKPIENRDWPCAHRGPLLIHAGKTWGKDEQDAHDCLLDRALYSGRRDIADAVVRSVVRLGGLIGIVRMIGCVDGNGWRRQGGGDFDGLDNWFVGPHGWRFTDAMPFGLLISYKGQQGLFRVPLDVVRDHFLRWEVSCDGKVLG